MSKNDKKNIDDLISKATDLGELKFDAQKWKNKYHDQLNDEHTDRRSWMNNWRLIMNSRITKYAAAAVLIMGVFWSINYYGGSIDGANVVWAEVASSAAKVESIHFYEFDFESGRVTDSLEGSYAEGKLTANKGDGTKVVDDGYSRITYDSIGNEISRESSEIGYIGSAGEDGRFFDELMFGILGYSRNEIKDIVPTNAGKDFLVYKFYPSSKLYGFAESVSVTVGRHSLLPIQLKIRRYGGYNMYNLYVFDYEQSKFVSTTKEAEKSKDSKNN